MEFEWRPPAVFDHQLHALDAEDVGDFVRVGDRGDGAVNGREPSELARHHHRAFDVDVGIDETGHDEPPKRPAWLFSNRSDTTLGDRDRAGKDSTGDHIDDVAGDLEGGHGISLAAPCGTVQTNSIDYRRPKNEDVAVSNATSPLPDRLRSLDALRGFDMFWIIGGDALGNALGKWYYGTSHNWISEQLEHAEWEGFNFYDLIFPLFLFMVGAVIPFSLAGMRRRGASDSAIYLRVVRRVILLFLLGLLSYGFLQLHWLVRTSDGRWIVDFDNHQRITGVLQRIAVCYGIAAVITLHTDWRAQLVTVIVILLGYWAILAWVPNPESGAVGDMSMKGNLGGYVDRHYLPGVLNPNYYGDRETKIAYGDNEGLLSTIPSVATALLGVLAGQWLRSAASAGRKTVGLAVAGVICLGLGVVWGWRFPVIKNLWTSSYVLIAAGWSFLLLALFYGIIDGLRWQAWAFPFVVIGMNAITIYVADRFIGFPQMTSFFLGGVINKAADLGPVVQAAGVLLFEWLFLFWLYRQRLFLRV